MTLLQCLWRYTSVPNLLFGDERLPERFWSKVIPEPNSGCWLWIGYWNSNGYGKLSVNGKQAYTHIMAYTALVGPYTEPELAHQCHTRSCCYPNHLRPSSHSDNCRDNHWSRRVECPLGHRYVETTTYTNPLTGHRSCLLCRALKNKHWNEVYRRAKERV